MRFTQAMTALKRACALLKIEIESDKELVRVETGRVSWVVEQIIPILEKVQEDLDAGISLLEEKD